MNDGTPARPDEYIAEIEQLLGGLVPVRSTLDAATVVAEAARRSEIAARAARQQAWLWRGVAAALAASLIVMAWIQRIDPSAGDAPQTTTMRALHGDSPADAANPQAGEPAMAATPADSAVPPAAGAYLVLRQRVIAQGLEALRDAPTSGAQPIEDDPQPQSYRAFGG